MVMNVPDGSDIPEFLSRCPQDDETNLKTADGQSTSGPAATEPASEDSDTGCGCAPEIAMETDDKQPGLETEDSSGSVDVVTAGETLDELGEDQRNDASEASWEPSLATHTVVEATLGGASEGVCETPEGSVCPSDPPGCPVSAESCEDGRQEWVQQGRRSSERSLQPPEMDPNPARGIQEEGAAAGAELAPWQADFNLEDVFKPVVARGQRSVRRSLRNQRSSVGSSAGLAWLPQTPPDSIRGERRRRRGRRLLAAPPLLSEET